MIESKEYQDRLLGADAVASELRQFKKLQHLDNESVAFRMAVSEEEVRKLRKMFGQAKVRLSQTNLSYHVRLTLGARGVKTVGELLDLTDGELLAIPTIGAKRLEHIRQCLREYFL